MAKAKRGLFMRKERECQPYKELYFKLHHLEQHADVLPEAKSLLLSFFSEALQSECKDSTILSIDSFCPATFDTFVREELDAVTREWHDYLARRKAGKHRELFQSAADARRWLIRMAPIKFVDGAWLGHIHKATTPFADRRTTKAAWQVLSEELGDGDLVKSHAYVYGQLLQKIEAPVVAPDSVDFIRHAGMDDARVWRSALSQLLISLFPHEFLPEILGFNLNFELLTLETLVTAKELREVGFDPYYFTLHITIGNADTGHTAMASSIVTECLRSVAARQGDAAAHQAWKRVQAGFVLCKNLNLPSDTNSPLTAEKEILDIFQAKAAASNRIHESCPVSFGGRSLSTWLNPEAFSCPEWQMNFLRCLSNAEPWVYKGNSSRSRLIQQLSWGGPMFGAFTDREVAVVRDWIDRLIPPGADAYTNFTGRTDMDESPPQNPDLRVDYPVFAPAVFDAIDASQALVTEPLTADMSKLDIHRLLPLWFTHPCLLESFVCVPWKVANPTGCAIVRFLRAQYGFLPEPVGVAGMDEMRRVDHIDLVDIGIEMLSRIEPTPQLPGTLAEVLERWPSSFAETMLATAMRPEEHGWVLLGMAQAFAKLHSSLATSTVLLPQSRAALDLIARREEESLRICVGGLHEGELKYIDFCKGYSLGRREIEMCF